MSEFLYYVRTDQIKANPATLDELKSLGLAHVFDGPATARSVTSGPDAMQGYTLSANTDLSHLKYVRDKQTWTQMGDVWIGYWNDRKPVPSDLARDSQIEGEWVQFSDGQNWHVPIARKYEITEDDVGVACTLPKRLVFEGGHWFTGGVKAQYADLWKHVMDYEAAIAAAIVGGDIRDGMVTFSYPHMNEMAISGLALNYRIGPYELNALEVFDEETRDAIISVLRDQKTYNAWSKKKLSEQALAGGDSSNGQEPETSDNQASTDQPQPTSTDGATDGTEAELEESHV